MSREQEKPAPAEATPVPTPPPRGVAIGAAVIPLSFSSFTASSSVAASTTSATDTSIVGDTSTVAPSSVTRIRPSDFFEMTEEEKNEFMAEMHQQTRKSLAEARAHPPGCPPHKHMAASRHWTQSCVILVVALLTLCF